MAAPFPSLRATPLQRRSVAAAVAVLWAAVVAAAPPPAPARRPADLWSLKPVTRPEIPQGAAVSRNPIDAFLARQFPGLKTAPPAPRAALLRRVSLDLTGLPPTPAELQAFLRDDAPDAYARAVDRLLAGEQHGVRYARHWLDVLRYADADEGMAAEEGFFHWRDWVIRALNDDVPYDEFVRAQLTGHRTRARTAMTATGVRYRVEPRSDDLFALGFLARGAVRGEGPASQELAIAAVETVSTAFMGITVGCAKCHDHMFDPISKRDFYAMKALFDPLVPRRETLASAADRIAAGRAAGELARVKAEAEKPMHDLAAPFRERLYEERVEMLPPEVRAVIRKPERLRSAAERKIADDYFPILRIDSDKVEAAMPEAVRKEYGVLRRRLEEVVAAVPKRRLEVFWTVEADSGRERETSYILTSGDPARPETNHPVAPSWPFAPEHLEFQEGRVEAFSDWLTAPDNPLFARVAVNRLWQWHFGTGLKASPSDFGALGGEPSNPELLDWLASEFVRTGFSMKQMHRLMVTSDAYQLSSSVPSADPALGSSPRAGGERGESPEGGWRVYPLHRLDAEAVWDSMMSAAGCLDPAVGGPSFDSAEPGRGAPVRRAAYWRRGYSPDRDVMAAFLQAFDVDDGRAPCPVRTRTVTAPQGLFLMNSPEADKASAAFAERLAREAGGDLAAAVDLAYRIALGRPPTPAERRRAGDHLGGDPARLKSLAWLLFNLDEFIYVP